MIASRRDTRFQAEGIVQATSSVRSSTRPVDVRAFECVHVGGGDELTRALIAEGAESCLLALLGNARGGRMAGAL
jgi:hypothetical protein